MSEPQTRSDPIARAAVAKMSWRILPLILLGYLVSFVDRVNALVAKTEKELARARESHLKAVEMRFARLLHCFGSFRDQTCSHFNQRNSATRDLPSSTSAGARPIHCGR